MQEEQFAWSTDPDIERKLHCLYVVLPRVAKQYDADYSCDLQTFQINLNFPEGTTHETQLECWAIVEKVMARAGLS